MSNDTIKSVEECADIQKDISSIPDERILAASQDTKFHIFGLAAECKDIYSMFRIIRLGLNINSDDLYEWVKQLSDEQISSYAPHTQKIIANLAINAEDKDFLARLEKIGYKALNCENLKTFSDTQIAESSEETKFGAFKIAYQCRDVAFASKLVEQGLVIDKNITDRLITDLHLQNIHVEEMCFNAKQICSFIENFECSKEMLGMCNFLVFEEL
jgi:hypothetical protein